MALLIFLVIVRVIGRYRVGSLKLTNQGTVIATPKNVSFSLKCFEMVFDLVCGADTAAPIIKTIIKHLSIIGLGR